MRLLFRGISTLAICLAPALVCAPDLHKKYFDSSGVQIRFIDQGTGQPVVLLHGARDNLDAAWIRTGVVANLAKDHRVIAMDLRGHGKSENPTIPKRTARRWVVTCCGCSTTYRFGEHTFLATRWVVPSAQNS